MIVGVLKEPAFEPRVSLLAESAATLTKKNIEVWVESGAGSESFSGDDDYLTAGAVVKNRREIIGTADILLSMHYEDIPAELRDKILIGVYQPLYNPGVMKEWASRNITCFSLDMLPRTTRAQSMDVLSSQANIAGYKSVLLAASEYPRYFPMFMTAAGTIPPAKVLILGAGVAGLQAIATAKRLGAVVEVFDTRPAVREEVLSLGAKFIDVEGAADASQAGGYAVQQSEEFQQKQKEKIAESLAKADIVITTAQIPGKSAPILISKEMIASMKKGSLIIDLAAATGGNTALTKNDKTIMAGGVRIIGNSNLAASMPSDASRLYARNLLNFLQLIIDKDNKINLNYQDELVNGCCITRNRELVHEKIKSLI
jgi:proton-translocating NAD(P)+ transhydrogenase subunit alpha